MKFNRQIILVIIITVYTILSTNCVDYNQQSTNNLTLEPTAINVIAEKDKMLTGGQSVWVIAQLYYNGEPLKKKGVNITFKVNDVNLATLPKMNYNLTDENGTTWILLTSGDAMQGKVKIIAFYNGRNGIISNRTFVDVTQWGNIGGIVFDSNGIGIPNANVSLWSCHYNGIERAWVNDNILYMPENPQLTNNGRTGVVGQYVFYRVPAGTYAVMAEKEGHSNASIVTIEQGTVTGLVNIPDALALKAKSDLPSPPVYGNSIWGIVCDQGRTGLPNVNVSLWHCKYNRSIGLWEKTTLVDLPDNPQKTGDGRTGPVGEYRFDNVPQGIYYVMSDGQWGLPYYAITRLNSNLVCSFIVVPSYGVIIEPPKPAPTKPIITPIR